MLNEQVEDVPYPFRFFFIDREPSTCRLDIITQNRASTDPLALSSGRAHFVAGPLSNQLPFKLRKREQNVQREPSERGAGIELLSNSYEADVVLIEEAQHQREVEQRPVRPLSEVGET